jgi:hypothetical protein
MIPSKVAALNIDSYVRSAVCAAALDNGNLVSLYGGQVTATAGQPEVWTAGQPATGVGLTHLWMVGEPEIVTVVSGNNKFRGIDYDPRNFYNAIGDVMTVFKLSVGDIFKITADGLSGSSSTGNFIVAANGAYLWTWAASTAAGSACTAQLVNATDYISIPDGSIGTQRVLAYKFQVIAVS